MVRRLVGRCEKEWQASRKPGVYALRKRVDESVVRAAQNAPYSRFLVLDFVFESCGRSVTGVAEYYLRVHYRKREGDAQKVTITVGSESIGAAGTGRVGPGVPAATPVRGGARRGALQL